MFKKKKFINCCFCLGLFLYLFLLTDEFALDFPAWVGYNSIKVVVEVEVSNDGKFNNNPNSLVG